MMVLVFPIFVSSKEDKLAMISEIQVKIERIDHSIIGDEDTVMAIIYYDKPVIYGDSDIALKINAFFEDEYQGWLNGSNRLNEYIDNWMDKYLRRVEEMRESFGDSSLERQPLSYTVDTEVILLNQDIISIKQTVYCFSGGPSGLSYFGSTFNVRTGQRIPFDDIVDVDADRFRENLSFFLIDLVSPSNMAVRKDWEFPIKKFYGPNELHNFDAYVNGNLYQLNYEYYYDGEYIYIPDNNSGYTSGTSDIVKWNGKEGDKFEASLLEH